MGEIAGKELEKMQEKLKSVDVTALPLQPTNQLIASAFSRFNKTPAAEIHATPAPRRFATISETLNECNENKLFTLFLCCIFWICHLFVYLFRVVFF